MDFPDIYSGFFFLDFLDIGLGWVANVAHIETDAAWPVRHNIDICKNVFFVVTGPNYRMFITIERQP